MDHSRLLAGVALFAGLGLAGVAHAYGPYTGNTAYPPMMGNGGGAMPMMGTNGAAMPMMGGSGSRAGQGGMPMMGMMKQRQAAMQQHMATMEQHLANIEKLLGQLVELQKP